MLSGNFGPFVESTEVIHIAFFFCCFGFFDVSMQRRRSPWFQSTRVVNIKRCSPWCLFLCWNVPETEDNCDQEDGCLTKDEPKRIFNFVGSFRGYFIVFVLEMDVSFLHTLQIPHNSQSGSFHMRHQVSLVFSNGGHFLVGTVSFQESFCFSRQINNKYHLKERTTHLYSHPFKELFWQRQGNCCISHLWEVETQFASRPGLEG